MSTENRVLVKVEDLQKTFGGKIHALDGISTEIKKNEVVVVIGPSGSGKSTFLRCLNLLELPTGGRILVNGDDITDPKTDINIHRQKMGMVFQQFNLFPHMTVLKNMTARADEAFEKEPRGGGEDRDGAFGARRPGRPRERLSVPAFGRPETAHRHRPRALHAAGHHAL